jgi:hypothetical protein
MQRALLLLFSIISTILKPSCAQDGTVTTWPPALQSKDYNNKMISIQESLIDCQNAINTGPVLPTPTCCPIDVATWTPNTCTGPDNACSGGMTYDQSWSGFCGLSYTPKYAVAIPPYLWKATSSSANGCQASLLCGGTIWIISPLTGKPISATVSDKAGAGPFYNGGINGLDIGDALFSELFGKSPDDGGTWTASWYFDSSLLSVPGVT